MKMMTVILTLLLTSCSSSRTLERKYYRAEDALLDINSYLRLTLNKIDIKNNKFRFDLVNVQSRAIEARCQRKLFEGKVIVKVDSIVKVFYHQFYRTLLQHANWRIPTTAFSGNEIIQYDSKLDNYIDLHKDTNLKRYLSANKKMDVLIKLEIKRIMVFPSTIASSTHSVGALTSDWQKWKPKM